MGCSPGDLECVDFLELPAHDVTIPAGFWIGQTLVTQTAWQKVTGKNPSFSKGPSLPVEMVKWDQSSAYTAQRWEAGLPTGAEWEYAARRQAPPWRIADAVISDDIAWYFANSRGRTHDVGLKTPNAYGLFGQLLGNNAWGAGWRTMFSSLSPTLARAGPCGVDPERPARLLLGRFSVVGDRKPYLGLRWHHFVAPPHPPPPPIKKKGFYRPPVLRLYI